MSDDLREQNPIGGQGRSQEREEQQRTQALQQNNERLRELTRMMQRMFGGAGGAGEVEAQAAQAPRGVLGRIGQGIRSVGRGIGHAGHRIGLRGDPPPTEAEHQKRRRGQQDQGAGFVRAQRVADLGATAARGLMSPQMSRTEMMMDVTAQGGAALAGTGAEMATGSAIAGQFAASATQAAIEAAQHDNRTRVAEMRGGLQRLEELHASGVDVTDEMLEAAAAEFDERGRRRADFQRRTAAAIDEQFTEEDRQRQERDVERAESDARGMIEGRVGDVEQKEKSDREIVNRLDRLIELEESRVSMRIPSL